MNERGVSAFHLASAGRFSHQSAFDSMLLKHSHFLTAAMSKQGSWCALALTRVPAPVLQ